MTSGYVSGNPSLADLVVVTNDPGNNELYVLQNTSTAAGLSFASNQISNSAFNGTPVVGQGVATGILSTKGAYTKYQDIAVAYAKTGTDESMVAVFQNLDGAFQFSRTSLPGATTPDFDAGQENPTAIALLFLTSSATGTTTPWEDIVVTNNDNFGTVSVLQPTALPTTTTAQPTPFTDTVAIPISQESEINNLTVTVALTDQQSVQNISIILETPNNEGQITLVDNQENAAGTATASVGLPSGNAIGVYGFTTGATGKPGEVIGTIFDDNATRDIFDSTTTGTNGNTAAGTGYIGYFRPEQTEDTGETLAEFIKSLDGDINGTWTLVITNYSSATTTGVAAGELEKFSLQFSTGMTAGAQPSLISETLVRGALGNDYPLKVPSSPNVGVGPGLVLAIDNTLGSQSPYQGRIYAAFVGYDNDGYFGDDNPASNTDIWLAYSDNGGQSWTVSASGTNPVNDDNADTDGYSGSSVDNPISAYLTGRTQFQPAIAVDQATGTLVITWRDARNDTANALVATYITTSIDGGNTFSPQTYANPPQTAIDAITDNTDAIGPAADNESADNPQADTTFGYGDQMGLAVFNGQVYPVWAGNFDQSDLTTTGIASVPLNIWYAPDGDCRGPADHQQHDGADYARPGRERIRQF